MFTMNVKSAVLKSVVPLLGCIVFCSTEASVTFGTISKVNSGPPPHKEVALMARYIVHNSDWLSIATISTIDSIKGYPFVSLKSVSDGPADNSSGVPYLYLTDMDVSGKDILVNNKVTVLVTLASSDYCDNNNYDPQDPRCAKAILSGTVVKINSTSPEYSFAKESLFGRHPAMKDWPEGHEFYVAKVDLQQILVLDYYGGISNVKLDDYFNANVSSLVNLDAYFRKLAVVVVVM